MSCNAFLNLKSTAMNPRVSDEDLDRATKVLTKEESEYL